MYDGLSWVWERRAKVTDIEIQRRALEKAWQNALDDYSEEPLKSVMDYALRGGKCLRGLLLISTTTACGGEKVVSIPPAVAIEMVHAASLAVDDLPALDGSDARRGRPALHRQFGEAQAILAAHALVAAAFQVLIAAPLESERTLTLIKFFSAAVGGRGMALGELLDIEKGNTTDRAVDQLKTAVLFQTAAEAGGLVAGVGDDLLALLGQFGTRIGCCYQTLDDLEDTPDSDDDSVNIRGDFHEQLAAAGRSLEKLQPKLADPAPLVQWLDWVSSLQHS